MKSKPKLLLVSAISPFPGSSGGATRIFHTIQSLGTQLELYLVFFLPPGEQLNPSDLAFLKQHTKYFTYFYKQPIKNPSAFINDFQPYWFSDWIQDEIKILLPTLIRQYKIRNVQLDCTQLLYLAPYLPSKVNKLFVAYDISTVSFWRRLAEHKNPVRVLLYFLFWIQIYIYEKRYLPLFNTVICMSQVDRDKLKKTFDLSRLQVIPNGINSIHHLPKKKRAILKLGYLGSFAHPPNLAAVKYFLTRIGPGLRQREIRFKYYLAGDNIKEDVNELVEDSPLYQTDSVVNLGQVENLSEFFERIDLLVVPIFSGSGTRIKILEALSFGVPVITTPVGAEGIDLHSPYLTVVNSHREFISAIIRLASELAQGHLITSQNSLETQLKPFIWSTIFKQHYSRLLK